MSRPDDRTSRPADRPGWLDDPALDRIWSAVRARLEGNGLVPQGTVTVNRLSRPERHAAAGLLGRPVTDGRLRFDLAELDTVLAERSGIGGLAQVVTVITGQDLVDRRAEQTRRRARREEPLALAAELLADRPWLGQWLDGLRSTGLLTRAADPARLIRQTAAITDLLAGGDWPVARTELAANLADGSHSLDDGMPLAALVLRALAAAAGQPPPTGPAQRRTLWESAGVQVDRVSSTCLTLGLRPAAADSRHPGHGSSSGARLDLAAEAGDPIHLTRWDLRGLRLDPPPRAVVCENPRVLEAVAERFGGTVPVVCANGRPTLVVLDVLRLLRGTELHYHGDFDWPGISITNQLITAFGVRPWRMAAADYLAAADPTAADPTVTDRARVPLTGTPVTPSWDDDLGTAMAERGVAVHEEAVLAGLLAELAAETAAETAAGLVDPGRSWA